MPRALPLLAPVATVAALALLSGCVPNNPTGGQTLSVAIDDESCAVSADTATSGAITFTLENTGTDVNEFEILAEDQLRIVGEKENVPPGQTVDYVAQLEPGTYYTGCKFRQVGAVVGLAEFTVTGEALEADADTQELIDAATTSYVDYIQSQVGELLPLVEEFTAAYAAGDDERARELYAAARVPYERIEPTAEAFGDLDPRIDYREVDALAEGLEWTGFHRIEKDLWAPREGDLNSDGTDALLDWAPSTDAERAQYAEQLVADVTELQTLVNADDFSVSIDEISNGAIALLDEVAAGKVTGEEDWWSGTDLSDVAANVQGASVAFGTVSALAEAQGDEGADLVAELEQEFADMEDALAAYGDLDSGFTTYGDVTAEERRALSNQVNALAEPLSQLTAVILGA